MLFAFNIFYFNYLIIRLKTIILFDVWDYSNSLLISQWGQLFLANPKKPAFGYPMRRVFTLLNKFYLLKSLTTQPKRLNLLWCVFMKLSVVDAVALNSWISASISALTMGSVARPCALVKRSISFCVVTSSLLSAPRFL